MKYWREILVTFREKARCELQLGSPRNLTSRGQYVTRRASPKIAAEAALDQDPPLIHPGVKEHHRSSFCLASAQLNSTSGRLFHKSHPAPREQRTCRRPPTSFLTHLFFCNIIICPLLFEGRGKGKIIRVRLLFIVNLIVRILISWYKLDIYELQRVFYNRKKILYF